MRKNLSSLSIIDIKQKTFKLKSHFFVKTKQYSSYDAVKLHHSKIVLNVYNY